MKIKWILGLILFAVGFVACSDDPDIPEPSSGRTVLVYMLANNSLSGYDTKNIDAMLESATAKNLQNGHLVVFHASTSGVPQLTEIKENSNGVITEHHIADYDVSNAADPELMQNVIADVKARYASDSYGLILWSHGSAWIPSDFSSMLRSFGQDGTNWLEIDELAKGLPDKGFDFILFDACYMASIECVYELRNKADYILASPTETMGDGWPYKLMIPYLFAPELNLQTVAECFYNYYNAQSGDYRTATVSLTRTSMLESLALITKEILSSQTESDIFNLNITQMQKLEFLPGSPRMLYDFSDYIEALATPEQFSRFTAALKDVVTYEAHTETAYFAALRYSYPINHCCGLSVYIPRETLPKINAWYQSRVSWYNAVYK